MGCFLNAASVLKVMTGTASANGSKSTSTGIFAL